MVASSLFARLLALLALVSFVACPVIRDDDDGDSDTTNVTTDVVTDTSSPDGTTGVLTLATTSLPDGIAGADYGPVTLEAQGGTPPYTWALKGDEAPRGEFLDSDTGILSGVLAAPGEFALQVQVTDSAGETAQRSLTLSVSAPEAFDSATGEAITSAEPWFGDFVVRGGDVISLPGATTLNVTGEFRLEPDSKIQVPSCDSLVINLVGRGAPAEILGDVTNSCETASDEGGDLIIRAVGSVNIGGDDKDPGTRIASSGDIFIGDPWYRPRPEPEVLEYVATVEPDDIGPTCAVTAAVLDAGEPPAYPVVVTLDVIHGDPDGGTTAIAEVDWGDDVVEVAPAGLTHSYEVPGLHEVLVTVADDEGSECTASMMLYFEDPLDPDDPDQPAAISAFRGPSSVWAAVEPFEAASLVRPVGRSFPLISDRSEPSATAFWELDGERIDCPPNEATCIAAAAASSPGVHEVVLTAESIDGELTLARLSVYAPLQGGEAEREDPPAPDVPFPAVPPSWVPDEFGGDDNEDKSHGDSCPACDLCEAPSAATGPVAVLGNTELTAWGMNGAIVIAWLNATVVIQPTLTATTAPGAPGATPGADGKSARGFAAASYSGEVVLCGGSFIGAPGGDGADNIGSDPNGILRGGRGAPWFGVLFTAPEGTISYCGDMTVTGADGGVGGDAENDADVGPGGACKNADSATAVGGRGGLGGGGMAYLAEEVCFDDDYSITFSCPGGGCFGGWGGDATSFAQTPDDCKQCDTYAGRGGHARSVAGRGGRSVWYFITRPDLAPDPEVYLDHLFPTGDYFGGDGGWADSTAGDGGDSECKGCSVEYSDAGNGGHARATGGRAGFGLSGRGAGGWADATSGFGGDAVSEPVPAKGDDGCPGKRGCTLYGFGGRSGIARAWRGRGSPNGERTVASGAGGDATVTGGDGGNGVGCPDCDGGRGGKAVAYGGRDTQGQPFRLDGTATATGGKGGAGSNCCGPPDEKGGDGGRGGNAVSITFPTGSNANKAGDGGAGGEGDPPGGGGAKGLGTGIPMDIPDGAQGPPGAPCPGLPWCPDPGPDCCLVDADCGVHPDQCSKFECTPNHLCISVPLNGVPCDDGEVCTDPDRCVEGVCTGTAQVPGCCHEDADCVDGNECTKDQCVLHACQNPPEPAGTPCEDGDKCTQEDTCQGGECTPGLAVTCGSDGNDCTMDTCNSDTGKCHDPEPDGTACEDGDACTTPDMCMSGVCEPGSQGAACVEDADCDDGDPCTINECVGDCGACVTSSRLCQDDHACTEDSCDAQSGDPLTGCVHDPVDSLCNDEDACTEDLCDPESGCTHSDVDCDDADVCTTDSCDVEQGCQYAAVTCPDPGVCKSPACSNPDGCGSVNDAPGTICDDGLCDGEGNCVGPLSLVGDCYVEGTPGGTVDLAGLVSGGVGTLSTSVVSMSPHGSSIFSLTDTSLSIASTHPDGTPGYMGVTIRITKGSESIDVVVVVYFASGGQGAFDGRLTSYNPDSEMPGSPLTGPQVLSTGESINHFFMEAQGASWVCTEGEGGTSCAWCWAMSVSTSVFIQRFVIGGDCNPACQAGETCVVGSGGPSCLSSDAAMGAQCDSDGEGNLYLTEGPMANQCSWLSAHLGSASSLAPDAPTPGNIPAVTGVDFSLGPTPKIATCGLIALNIRYTASAPLMCFERLQSGDGVSTFNAAFVFRSVQ